ncbi:PadR family transcriptional regulator [Streptomyces radicis]|uniref:PadR family transcriptional regulator n=1 Tax=Streptomyces radicis TaxID=1750517 RepID=A0A3A9WYW1_9ACTN|nr:PadR family transcriptional regulator [Streptomyces radicis]RKN26611.1 PadR family transcriptional regulator [Streptomyces radicis]
MSIRFGLLALLESGPRHGSRLRAGQVYTTLGRLERDGLIVPEGGGDAKRQLYAITPEGRAQLAEWYARPADRTQPSRLRQQPVGPASVE